MAAGRSIREVVFEGGHFEWGLQRGRRLRDTLVVPDLSGLPRGFVEGCRDAAEALHPAAVQEFEGLVRGGGFDRDRMMAYYFARLESRLGGCTMFGVTPACRDAGEGPIVGRNYDWAVEDLKWCELHRYCPAEGLRRIGYTHHWAGCPDVFNESGFYVAIASLSAPREPAQAPGVQWSILVDMMSESCCTVEEALQVCSGVQHLRPMSYLFADASGSVAVVEATPWQVCRRRPQNGYVVAANVALGGDVLAKHGEEPAHTNAGEERPAVPRALWRVKRTAELLQEEMPAVSDECVRRILADHEAPICTGDHRHADGAPWATIWSGICLPAEEEFRIAPGLPCRYDYQDFTFG